MKKETTIDNAPDTVGRRRLLKTMAGAAGVVGTSTLPGKWVKPTVDAALLPAHAQASGCNLDCDIRFVLDWFNEQQSAVDLDLEIITPVNGTRIAAKPQFGPQIGTCMQHLGDSNTTADGNETIGPISDGLISAGRYQVFVRNNTREGFSGVRVRVPRSCGATLPTVSRTDIGNDTINTWGSISISSGGTIRVNLGPPPP